MRKLLLLLLVITFSIRLGDANIQIGIAREKQREVKYITNLKRKIYRIKITKRLYMNKDTVKHMDSLLNIVDIYEGTHSYYLYNIDSIVEKGDILIIN